MFVNPSTDSVARNGAFNNLFTNYNSDTRLGAIRVGVKFERRQARANNLAVFINIAQAVMAMEAIRKWYHLCLVYGIWEVVDSR